MSVNHQPYSPIDDRNDFSFQSNRVNSNQSRNGKDNHRNEHDVKKFETNGAPYFNSNSLNVIISENENVKGNGKGKGNGSRRSTKKEEKKGKNQKEKGAK